MDDGTRPMRGRVCMVTGATAGIGLATAEALAAECLARHARLHVLVNNVGAFFMGRSLTAEGFEATFALNYWNIFLLTRLLEPALLAGAPARIVNVSSDSHRGARLDLRASERARGGTGLNAYGQSKLALTSFNYELARRLQGTGVTVNAVHPGFVASNMYDEYPMLRWLVAPVVRRVGRSNEAGADTVVYLASAAEVTGVTGKYFLDRKAVSSSPATYDEEAARRLWELSERMVGLQ
jgi:NAD(P)-dependent dehydrogenase (short-subunit alcohol dehydrogenase family)